MNTPETLHTEAVKCRLSVGWIDKMAQRLYFTSKKGLLL